MRMKLLIICIFHLINTYHAAGFAGVGDKSFYEMCTFWGGASSDYKERLPGNQAMTGDSCSMSFPIGMGDKESAIRYCEDNVPFHIRSAEVKEFETICRAEATLKCDDGWTQMFGRCYKIEKKMVIRDHAVDMCKSWNQKATIAFMHRETLPFRIRDYFTGVSRIWMDASETVTNVLEYKTGPHLLLAIDGYKYALPNLAFAQVPIDETAMALCEYTPDMTQSESNWLLGRYGEIYYPIITTSDRTYVRSANSYQRSEGREDEHKLCKSILRPFLHTDAVARAAEPTTEFLDELSKKRDATIIRTAVYSGDTHPLNRKNKLCTSSSSINFGYDHYNATTKRSIFKTVPPEVWRKGQPAEVCDGATWSTGIVMSREGQRRLETMSDARFAPIYCQTNFESLGYGDCPPGYAEFSRHLRGQKFCHKFIEKEMTYSEAQSYCMKNEHGSAITGFSELNELVLLDKLITDAMNTKKIPKTMSAFLGSHRRAQCTKEFLSTGLGYNKDPTHPCSLQRIFEWTHGVAQNPPIFEKYWVVPSEPNFMSDNEGCVELLRGKFTRPNWPTKYVSKVFNDIPCDTKLYFFCGKEAPIISHGYLNQ